MSLKNPSLNYNHLLVDDLILYPYLNEELIRDLPKFKTSPGDVFLVTYPKAGTFWLGEIVYNIAKPKGISDSNEENRVDAIPLLEYVPQAQLEAYPSPRYVKTHLPYDRVPHNSQHNIKYIYLARNPRDVAVSYFHNLRGIVDFEWDGTWKEFLGYFMQGKVPYGSYCAHVLEWWKHKDDENLLFIKYEDMKQNLKGHVNLIAEFLGFNLTEEESKSIAQKCMFQAMKANPKTNLDQYPDFFKPGNSFMRKGIIGDWSNYFADEQLTEFDKWCKSHMDGIGLEFEFTV
jgi:hypothetical protein